MTIICEHLKGLYTAIVTPFTSDGRVDIEALQALTRFQISAGVSGIVPIGGTGEYPALSRRERRDIVAACVDAADGTPVIPGILATGYEDALEAAIDFRKSGATAVMTVTPYYAPGDQAGMRAYFRRYRDDAGLPVLLYQTPRRTNVAAIPECIQAMAEDGSIIGMKFSSMDIPDFIRTVRFAGDKIAILSGEEPLFATHVALGARGGVLASASLCPRTWLEIFALARSGDLTAALDHQRRIDPMIETIFLEMNPGPLKALMAMVGKPMGSVRLPLLPPTRATEEKLKATADHCLALGIG
ncbi:MAG: dihydrodipicolinate synthase family protein [Alphaproteobacteria bacterium]|nr:dihydrodipicolinate synthase family protein [Alphaproteobacteria bacterium]